MRIVCPNCSAEYEVDGRLFGPEGRSVQCAQCETQWTQYPADDPVETDVLQPEPLPASAPTPSQKLPEAERSAIRAAVEEEIAIRDQNTFDDVGADRPSAGEDDFLKSLREQLTKAEKEYEATEKTGTGKPRPTGRRNLKAAADMAGVDVEIEEERKPKKKKKVEDLSSDLAVALQEYERERKPRRPGRWGFITALVIGAAAFGTYISSETISEAYPDAAPALASYVSGVDWARGAVQDLFVEAQGLVSSALNEAGAGDTESTPASQ